MSEVPFCFLRQIVKAVTISDKKGNEAQGADSIYEIEPWRNATFPQAIRLGIGEDLKNGQNEHCLSATACGSWDTAQ